MLPRRMPKLGNGAVLGRFSDPYQTGSRVMTAIGLGAGWREDPELVATLAPRRGERGVQMQSAAAAVLGTADCWIVAIALAIIFRRHAHARAAHML